MNWKPFPIASINTRRAQHSDTLAPRTLLNMLILRTDSGPTRHMAHKIQVNMSRSARIGRDTDVIENFRCDGREDRRNQGGVSTEGLTCIFLQILPELPLSCHSCSILGSQSLHICVAPICSPFHGQYLFADSLHSGAGLKWAFCCKLYKDRYIDACLLGFPWASFLPLGMCSCKGRLMASYCILGDEKNRLWVVLLARLVIALSTALTVQYMHQAYNCMG